MIQGREPASAVSAIECAVGSPATMSPVRMLRAWGLPRGPNMRIRLFGWVPVVVPNFSKPSVL
jgi:hypothetical protein